MMPGRVSTVVPAEANAGYLLARAHVCCFSALECAQLGAFVSFGYPESSDTKGAD